MGGVVILTNDPYVSVRPGMPSSKVPPGIRVSPRHAGDPKGGRFRWTEMACLDPYDSETKDTTKPPEKNERMDINTQSNHI